MEASNSYYHPQPFSDGLEDGQGSNFTAKSAKNAKKELKLGILSGLRGSKNQTESRTYLPLNSSGRGLG
jgi:hypothetical protein